MKKWICDRPFVGITVNSSGDVVCGCTRAKVGHIYGNIYTNNFEEIWNSDNAKKMRYCVSEGNFEYCYSKLFLLKD